MKNILRILAAAGLVVGLLAAPGWTAEAPDGFTIVHVQDLAAWIGKDPKSLSIYDANPSSVRENEGIIPGAKLLSSISNYDLGTLPGAKDSKLVFYCHNTH
jgi:hypothetical protein